ncbi:MAG: transcriptional repressor [Planctomycetes bacterium]|nr:transcriptional repressor [Planctomycetota bacterium]
MVIGKNIERTEKMVEHFREVCRESGLKVTPQRVEIYRALASTKMHPDVEMVRESLNASMPNLSTDTIYRTLSMFEEFGLVTRIEAIGNRARYDADTSRHPHFFCTECGCVKDFHCDEMETIAAPRSAKKLGRVDSVHIHVRGVCNECLAKE